MSNDVTMSPLIIDTAGASDLMLNKNICIERIRWVGATTAGHTAVVQNGAGRVIWAGHAKANNDVDDSDVNQWFTGLIVPTLASGKLYIYYH
jgi:hypothetical protein